MVRPSRFLLPRAILEAMIAQARAEVPNECCGLLAGKPGEATCRIEQHFPLTNAAASPVRYDAEPRDLLRASKAMRAVGLDIVAIYHSHPTAPALPSRVDRVRNYSEDVPNFIISLMGAEPIVRGWWLTAEDSRETDWEILEP
jgi:proteasome lid subunit RPN8/RPN11